MSLIGQKPTQPEIQNVPAAIPRGIRKHSKVCRALLEADFASIERRILAIGKPDIHFEAAKIIFRIDQPDAEQRKVAKVINYGIMYGVANNVSYEQLLRKWVRPPRRKHAE